MLRSMVLALMAAAALLVPASIALAADDAAPATNDAASQPATTNADTPADDPATSGPNDPRRKNPPVAFTDVNYEDAGDAGKLTLSGKGDPGAQIQLYFDNQALGQVVIGEDGTWKFESNAKMGGGQHMFRADRIDEKNGVVLGRASIIVARMDQKPEQK
jgi:hypothetical protein